MKKRLPIFTDHITDNWVYKLVALMVAVSIWVTTLHSRKDVVQTVSMAVEFLLKPNMTITNEVSRLVLVKVAGTKNTLRKFSQTSHVINVNLSSESPGTKIMALKPADISLPMGVKLLSVEPAKIEVQIAEVGR
jgi:YbbR domain-containing protein